MYMIISAARFPRLCKPKTYCLTQAVRPAITPPSRPEYMGNLPHPLPALLEGLLGQCEA